MSRTIWVLLLTIVFLGGILRFWGITSNPPSLNIDEVSIGYNAYSILKTGKDEYGTLLPLSFKSVGDYKPPVLVYLTVPSIALFGLTEFAVRFPTALISTIGIVIMFFFARKLSSSIPIALAAALLFAISPWVLYYSRYGVEATVAMVFLMAGALLLLKFIDKKTFIRALLAAFFLVLSMYAYHTNRLLVPLLGLAFLLFNRKDIVTHFKKYIVFGVIFLLLSCPLFISTLYGPDKTRAQTTFITRDIEYQRVVLLQPHEVESNLLSNDTFLLIFHGVRKYLNYFTPNFLFINGLNMTRMGSYNLGVLYLFEIPFLFVGLYLLLRNKSWKTRWLVFSWIILGIIPASLTQNEQHPLRTLVVAPMAIILSAIGLVFIVRKLLLSGYSLKKTFAGFVFLLFIIWNLSYAFMIFSVQFPREKSESFMGGTKETALFALQHQREYDQIFFDPVRGIEGPYIVSIPHMYLLFYGKYDPHTYQTEPKNQGNEVYGFSNYTIRKVNWNSDKRLNNSLLIASPWSLPEKDIPEYLIKEKVYLSDGKLAFLIVETMGDTKD